MTQENEILRLVDISKSFPNGSEQLELFNTVNLSINIGDTISVTGESASGKSTFLHIAAGLEGPTSGNVYWIDDKANLIDVFKMNDNQISKLRNQKVGFIFQNNFLLDDFKPIENIMMPALILGKSETEARNLASELLDRFSLSYLAERSINTLSGGEKQRVSVCRALINNPKIVFADEPTGALDEDNARIVEDMLLELGASGSCALVLVTHNPKFAAKCTSRYILKDKTLSIME